jgi:hypothetical protein
MNDGLRELRLRYSLNGMVRLIELVDHMKLGEMPEELAVFLVHASDAANWHDVEESP